MRYALFSILLICTTMVGATNDYNETIIDSFNEEELGRGENLARVTFADDGIRVSHEGMDEPEALIRNMPVLSGDLLETSSGSYAEVEFIDGSRMQFADRTTVEFQAINEVYAGESLTVLKLYDGSLFLHSSSMNEALGRRVIRIDTEAGSAYVEAPGIYRVDMEGSRMQLRVYRGFAELSGEDDSRAVYSGEYATIRGMRHPSRARNFNSFRADRFERWAYSRRPATSVSGKYVDNSLNAYASDLDGNGTWQYDDGIRRHVWVPRVSAGWAPYRNGFWYNAGYRMTWVSRDPWGWVTHHYGRWMYNSAWGWYWCPGSYYSPAWVAWNSYDDYIGWCPLGYWNEPFYYRNTSYPRTGVQINIRNTVVVGNYWNYIPATAVVNRRRSYGNHNVVVSGTRRITTRPLHINRRNFSEPSRLTRVINDPTVNRRHADERSSIRTAGSILTPGRRTGVATTTATRGAVRIESRSTGTSAPSRFANTTRRTATSTTTSRTVTRATTPERRTTRILGGEADKNANNRNSATASRNNPVRRNNNSTATRGTTTNRTTTTNRSNADRTVKRATTPSRNSNTNRVTTPSRNSNRNRATTPTRGSNATRTTAPTRSAPTTRSNNTRTAPPKRQYNSGGNNRSYSPPKATRSKPSSRNNSSGNSNRTVKRSSSNSGSKASSSNNSRSSSTRSTTTSNSRSSNRRGGN